MDKMRKRLIKLKEMYFYNYVEMAQAVGISHVTLQNFMKGGEFKQGRILKAITTYLQRHKNS